MVCSLFFLGRTEAKKDKSDLPATPALKAFNINQFIAGAKKNLSPTRAIYLGKLENSITRGDISTQQIQVNKELAKFWKDSIHAFEPYAFYLSEAAKLDKSEKSLTFAAQLISGYLRGEQDDAKRIWMADLAIELFEKVISLNPSDSIKVEMGACYIFGYASAGRSDKAMKGIFMLRDIVDKDSSNLRANMLVGIGGVFSGQYDKAILRLRKVVDKQPTNAEAVSWLADAYAGKGDKVEAVKWYQVSKRLMNDPEYSRSADERVKALK